MEDVEALNLKAKNAELDITKLSYAAFARLTESYQLLQSGGALGHGCGPLLIAKNHLTESQIQNASIAIPGEWTTANFLLSIAFPSANNKIPLLFSDIEQKVLEGSFDAGLIIHENRFTYAQKGLLKIIDLGEYWENLTWLPIPLGGIVIRRNFPDKMKKDIQELIAASVQCAFDHPLDSMTYVRQHAQEMQEEVMKQHIQLYVNEYSVKLGEKGQTAVRRLIEAAIEKGIIPKVTEPLWVE
jgi:1,4-dihydroxy-6-naphthoate synthase